MRSPAVVVFSLLLAAGAARADCPTGSYACGSSYCTPNDGVCCASVGRPNKYCPAGTTCTTSGTCQGSSASDSCTGGVPTVASCGSDTCSCADSCSSNSGCKSGCCFRGYCALSCACETFGASVKEDCTVGRSYSTAGGTPAGGCSSSGGLAPWAVLAPLAWWLRRGARRRRVVLLALAATGCGATAVAPTPSAPPDVRALFTEGQRRLAASKQGVAAPLEAPPARASPPETPMQDNLPVR